MTYDDYYEEISKEIWEHDEKILEEKMNKRDIKNGMKLKMKNGKICTSLLLNGKMFFRFRDSTNDIIAIDQYDDNLNCGVDRWTITSEVKHELIPILIELPKVFSVKNIKTGEICEAHHGDYGCYDVKEVKIEQHSYNSNECEGVIDSTLFDEKVVKYYIFNKYGENVQVNEIVLINSFNEKETLSYNSLCEHFEYIEH
jgi:hypothetical protein